MKLLKFQSCLISSCAFTISALVGEYGTSDDATRFSLLLIRDCSTFQKHCMGDSSFRHWVVSLLERRQDWRRCRGDVDSGCCGMFLNFSWWWICVMKIICSNCCCFVTSESGWWEVTWESIVIMQDGEQRQDLRSAGGMKITVARVYNNGFDDNESTTTTRSKASLGWAPLACGSAGGLGWWKMGGTGAVLIERLTGTQKIQFLSCFNSAPLRSLFSVFRWWCCLLLGWHSAAADRKELTYSPMELGYLM